MQLKLFSMQHLDMTIALVATIAILHSVSFDYTGRSWRLLVVMSRVFLFVCLRVNE